MDKVHTSVLGKLVTPSDNSKSDRSRSGSQRPQEPQGRRSPTSREATSLTGAAAPDNPPALAKASYRRLQKAEDAPPVTYCRATVSDRRQPGLSIMGKLLHTDTHLGCLSLMVGGDELAVAKTMRHAGIESTGDGVWTVFFNLHHIHVNVQQDTKEQPRSVTPDSLGGSSREITRVSGEGGQQPRPDDTSKCCVVS